MERVVGNVVDVFPTFRLGQQMDRQGRFIEELKRTRSFHYSVFVVEGSARLASIGECVGKDLWAARLEDGRGLETARGFLAKYGEKPGEWPFPDIDKDKKGTGPMVEKFAGLQLLFERGSQVQGAFELP
jgi:hypothetical protein